MTKKLDEATRLLIDSLPESLKDFACGVTKEGNKYRTTEVREYRYDNDEYSLHEYELEKNAETINLNLSLDKILKELKEKKAEIARLTNEIIFLKSELTKH